MDNTPAAADKKAHYFTVHDVFSEALYCCSNFADAVGDAERIGCSLIIEMTGPSSVNLAGVQCRYRKENGEWHPEVPRP